MHKRTAPCTLDVYECGWACIYDSGSFSEKKHELYIHINLEDDWNWNMTGLGGSFHHGPSHRFQSVTMMSAQAEHWDMSTDSGLARKGLSSEKGSRLSGG
jgi:hypothetical protein